jgi:hypothetical protein
MTARLDGLKAALAILALMSVIALFFSRRIPSAPIVSGGNPTHTEPGRTARSEVVG